VSPWLPAIPLKVGPFEAGGDTPIEPLSAAALAGVKLPKFARSLAMHGSRDIQRGLDRPIQLLYLGSVASPHEPAQTLARDGEDVVEVCNASDGQPLVTAEHDLARKTPNRPGDQGNHDPVDGVENGISRQNDDWSASNRGG
jgi:hypothetical protein